ncbi:cyclase family protein [Roseomonas sp. OT10]|uniref:cyclase family protein n=1 Tax=Roseomonas cutis TaxID=2897332 RepID=UPI001E61667A|nr:cyclase family protein [Roseomonas sp. OT10]UFN50364.1 cyclase family protein [Roseomonas sp. OT10]
MCPPGCLQAMHRHASRRGLLGGGLAAVAVAAAGAPAAAQAPPSAPAVTRSFTGVQDLTHPLYDGFPTFDGSRWFTTEPMLRFAKDRMNINRWTLVEHTGTHLDAPLHFTADGRSIDAIPASELVLPVAVIDIRQRAQEDADTTLTPDDIRRWEAANGPLPEGCCVVMNSGWHRLLDSPRFTNRDAAGVNHMPGFHAETAAMLMAERQVRSIGVDTLSLDPGRDATFPVHYAWLGSGRWGIEGLANLDALPAKGAQIVVGAPKVRGATGGPGRILALV